MNNLNVKEIVKKSTVIIFTLIAFFLILSGCASKPGSIKSMPRSDDFRHKPAADIFAKNTLTKKSARLTYQHQDKKLIILLDEGVQDQQNLKKTLENLLMTLPDDIQYNKEIKSFGYYSQTKGNLVSLPSALKFYIKSNQAKINTDIIILTQWQQINNESIHAAERLLIKTNQKFCLHLIGIGNIHKNKRLIKPQYCGSSVSSQSLLAVNQMKKFVADIFYKGPIDTDRDGIYDDVDQCPRTPKNSIITWNGCARDSKTSNPRYLITNKLLTNQH